MDWLTISIFGIDLFWPMTLFTWGTIIIVIIGKVAFNKGITTNRFALWYYKVWKAIGKLSKYLLKWLGLESWKSLKMLIPFAIFIIFVVASMPTNQKVVNVGLDFDVWLLVRGMGALAIKILNITLNTIIFILTGRY